MIGSSRILVYVGMISWIKIELYGAHTLHLLVVFCPKTAPEMISEGLKSKIFLGGHIPNIPLAVCFVCYEEIQQPFQNFLHNTAPMVNLPNSGSV